MASNDIEVLDPAATVEKHKETESGIAARSQALPYRPGCGGRSGQRSGRSGFAVVGPQGAGRSFSPRSAVTSRSMS